MGVTLCFSNFSLEFINLTAAAVVYTNTASVDVRVRRARAVCIGSIRTRSSREVRLLGTAVTSSSRACVSPPPTGLPRCGGSMRG